MAKHITLAEALKTERLTPFGNAVAGAMGAVVSSAMVYPLDTSVYHPALTIVVAWKLILR